MKKSVWKIKIENKTYEVCKEIYDLIKKQASEIDVLKEKTYDKR